MISWQLAALLLLGGSTVLLFMGIPVAFSFLAINIVGAWLYLGGAVGIEQIVRNSVVAVANFSLTPIPLFVLMGEILFHTGLAIKVIDCVERLIRQVPGRLAVVAVVFSLIGAFYYLRIVKLMYFEDPVDAAPLAPRADMSVLLTVNGVAVLVLGILPQQLMQLCYTAIKSL